MGPHSDECGNLKICATGDIGNKLQWGRTLMSAEIKTCWMQRSIDNGLQWGRTLMSAEMPVAVTVAVIYQALQWGRTLMSAEIVFDVASRRAAGCFNGAAL